MFFWNCIFLTVLIFCLGIYFYFSRKVELFEKSGIPFIKPWPIIGNMGPIILKKMSLGHLLEKLYFMNTKAKYIGFYEFTTPVILIRDPMIIKSIGTKNYHDFYNRRGFADDNDNLIMGHDLFSLKDEKWRQMKNILSPSFTLGKFKEIYPFIARRTQECMELICKNGKGGNETRMKNLFQKLVFDIIFAFSFDIDTNFVSGEGVREIGAIFNGLNPENAEKRKLLMFHYPFLFKILRFEYFNNEQKKFLENIVYLKMEERNKEGNFKSNMIDIMLGTSTKKLSIEEMSAQVFVMFAGAFNVSDTLQYLSYYIAVNSEVQIKLQDEIDKLSNNYKSNQETINSSQHQPEGKSKVPFEDIMNLKYLDAVLKESLRLQTQIVSLERICSKSFQLPPALPGSSPFTVKPKMLISIPIESIHRDGKYFPNPEKFDPDRFYNVNDKTIFNSYTYLPFGIGPRHCIANRFSTQAMKIIIFYILANCNIQVCPKTQIPLKIDRRKLAKMPDKSIILRIEKRINSNGK